MASDLISRDALIRDMYEDGYFPLTVADKATEKVMAQPTVDAAPVVHGEWIYENYTWHCGKCGFHPFKGYIPKTPGFKFCPNCGAKMDGGENGNCD